MDFSLSLEQQQIRDSIFKLCAPFDDGYWLEKDRSGEFPHELHAALAEAGWLGIAMPEQYGGADLGVTEAAILMQAIAKSGAAMSGVLPFTSTFSASSRWSFSVPGSRSSACCRR